ncbi:MAG: hypothetical protein WCA10_09685 [Terracidiphilus sp.]
MKRFIWLVVILLIASPGWAVKKMTEQQLKDLLAADQRSQKSDAEVAADLKDIDLTEELTHSTMDSFKPLVPGQLTTEQLFVLEIRSAVLPPPASEIPATAAPDATKQKAILDKATDYATKTYAQMPALTATRTLRRFQDSAQQDQPALGSHGSAVLAATYTPIRYTASDDASVTFKNGTEVNPLASEKAHWGENSMIALLGQAPEPAAVLQEAQAAGKISWLRWETVAGHDLAVFSYSVDKKKSHYAVDYCCFPGTSQAGPVGMRGTVGGGDAGNYQTSATWKNFKSNEAYRGEIFVDPDTGIIYRLITQVEFKGSDPVKAENQRIDYGVETIGDKKVVVPGFVTIDTVEQPFPDSPQGRYILRHTLFTENYSGYKLAGS